MESFGEAPSLNLIEARTITYPHDKKIFVTSTPTVASTSVIEAEFLKGSQHRYYVTCPACQEKQILEFKQVRWPDDCKDKDGCYDLDRVEREAKYHCCKCNAAWTESDKIGLVRNGEWIATNNKAPSEIISCHISALYSFSVTWGALAKVFLLAKDDAGKLHDFYNSYLGECFEQQAVSIKENDIDELIKVSPDYQKRELIKKPALILMGADVQQTMLYYAACAFYSDGSSSLVDYGSASTFDDLFLISQTQYLCKEDNQFYAMFKGVIDLGYAERKIETLDYCLATGLKFIPIYGRNQRQGLLSPVRETTTPYKGMNIPTLHIDDGIWKNHLFIRLIQQREGRFYLPQYAKLDLMLRQHLTAERLVERNINGKKSLEWVLRSRENHIADCLKYIHAYASGFQQAIQQQRTIELQQLAAAKAQPVNVLGDYLPDAVVWD